MFLVKPIKGFLIWFVIVYGVLVAITPLLENTYARFFRAGGEFVFGSFGSNGRVFFRPRNEPGDAVLTTVILVTNQERIYAAQQAGTSKVDVGEVFTSSRLAGYFPTIFLLSLIAASPISFSRKMWALWWGFVLINFFIIFILAIEILSKYTEYETTLAVVLLPQFWKKVLFACQKISLHCVTTIIVPVFIWILVTFRRDDWMMLRRVE